VYRRANQGRHIAFAARGVRVVTGYPSAKSKAVSGTSFAAPIVAVALAHKIKNGEIASRDAVLALQHEAQDLGAPGKDSVFGWGIVEPRP
jgi:hypothetical protein